MDGEQPERKRWQRLQRLKINRNKVRGRARKIENATVKHAHKFLTKRWQNVRDVGRHTIAWLVLVTLLIGSALLQFLWFQKDYSVAGAQAGGTYAEGVVGRMETINPLFASSTAEISASNLIFSSLLSHDRDDALKGDLADSWSVTEEGKVYTVKLRSGVKWHDNKPLTADDVIFTVKLMQDRAVRAVQYGNWVGVKTEKISADEIKFTLPLSYAPFAHNLTFGVLPKHLLSKVKPANLRENEFGRKPVGTGPFVFRRIQLIDPNKDRLVVHMEANNSYHGGRLLLNRFQLHTYEDRSALKRAFVTDEVNAALGLNAEDVRDVVLKYDSVTASPARLKNATFAFLNNDNQLLKDVSLRQALVSGTDRSSLQKLLWGRVLPIEGPLLDEYVGGNIASQAGFNRAGAIAKLEAAGWKLTDGVRQKDGQKLTLSVVAPDSGDYKKVCEELARQWRKLGVDVKVHMVDPSRIASEYLQPRSYDVLVYELSLGSDPDVYAYWHSSQVHSNALNFANYKSGLSDDALSSARARLDSSLRQAKYRTFVEQWVKDAPAVALYRPLLNYITRDSSRSVENEASVAEPVTRYRDIKRWSVTQSNVMRTP